MIQKRIDAKESDIDRLEGVGAMKFLALDDLMVTQEGESVDPLSVIALPHHQGLPQFPAVETNREDPFIQSVNASGKKWVILTDEAGIPSPVMNANEFLRVVLFGRDRINIRQVRQCPVIVANTRVINGSDILERLLHGVTPPREQAAAGT